MTDLIDVRRARALLEWAATGTAPDLGKPIAGARSDFRGASLVMCGTDDHQPACGCSSCGGESGASADVGIDEMFFGATATQSRAWANLTDADRKRAKKVLEENSISLPATPSGPKRIQTRFVLHDTSGETSRAVMESERDLRGPQGAGIAAWVPRSGLPVIVSQRFFTSFRPTATQSEKYPRGGSDATTLRQIWRATLGTGRDRVLDEALEGFKLDNNAIATQKGNALEQLDRGEPLKTTAIWAVERICANVQQPGVDPKLFGKVASIRKLCASLGDFYPERRRRMRNSVHVEINQGPGPLSARSVLAAAFLTACAGSGRAGADGLAKPPGSPASNRALLIGSISPSGSDTGPASTRSGRIELVWLGPGLPAVGASLALFSEKGGYAGFVRVTAQPEPPDNLKRLVVEVIDGSVPDPAGVTTVAVGPLDAPPRRAQVLDIQKLVWWSTSEWLVAHRVDFEGDGEWDAESVVRCGHFLESKCGRACDEQCVGTRRSGQRAPDPATVECSSFIPERTDRFPDIAGKC